MILLIVLLFAAPPPDSLSLEQCYRLAEAHHPSQRERALLDDITALNLDNLDVRFLPNLSLRSQATYQSHVPAFPLSLPGVTPPTIARDQYRVSLNLQSLLFDSGLTARQRDLERIQHDLSQQQISVQLYQLRDQVNTAYFGVLMQDARLATLSVLAEDLRARHEQVLAGVRANALLPGNAEVLEVERIKVAQQQSEAAANRQAALDVLGELTGRVFDEETALAMPDIQTAEMSPEAHHRPEYEVFSLNQSLLTGRQELLARKNRLQVSSFAEAAYGRPPGLDIFENSFQPFFSLGLQVQWPFWDWGASRRERASLALQQERVQAQEDAFAQQIRVASRQSRHDIDRLQELLSSDDEIITLRERIAAQAASQLEHGVITATEYLIERNAAHQARLTRDLHALQLAFARAQYATTIGNP